MVLNYSLEFLVATSRSKLDSKARYIIRIMEIFVLNSKRPLYMGKMMNLVLKRVQFNSVHDNFSFRILIHVKNRLYNRVH